MNGDIGKWVENCPLGFDVCYPSCYWWRPDYVCVFQVERSARKELADLRAMRDMSRYGHKPPPRERNPVYKQMGFEGPRLVRPKREKEDPEAHLPWRMFAQYGSQFCKKCRMKRPATFVVAKSRASADKVLMKGNGLCPSCMCQVLLAPRERIAVLDGGVPNPLLTFVAPKAHPVVIMSPYRLFGFTARKPRKCGCGNDRWQYYVIARNLKEAEERVDRYGQCALCICELLCLDRYAIETTDGGLP